MIDALASLITALAPGVEEYITIPVCNRLVVMLIDHKLEDDINIICIVKIDKQNR